MCKVTRTITCAGDDVLVYIISEYLNLNEISTHAVLNFSLIVVGFEWTMCNWRFLFGGDFPIVILLEINIEVQWE
jgi:hypothetical protein